MKIALIGYGKMGQTIERLALKRGHTISAKVSIDNPEGLSSINSSNTDVCIEFSAPDAAYNNVTTSLEKGIPTLSGTTGWNEKIPEVERFCHSAGGTFFYASNFSLGVNLLFWFNQLLAKKMNEYSSYAVELEETHHIHKLDEPSGTAISLAEQIIKELDGKSSWVLGPSKESSSIPITSIRKEEIPGTHIVSYENEIDKIVLSHEAKSRDGFALGAIMVAEWLKDKKGVYTMKDFLNL